MVAEQQVKTTTLAAEKAEAVTAAERAATTYTDAKRAGADEDTLELLRLRCIEAENAIGALTR